MGINAYDVGDLVRLTATFSNAAGVLASPTTVTLTVTKPDGTAASGTTPSNTGTGTYRHDLAVDQGGIWRYRWVSTGDPTTAEEGIFFVRRQGG